MCLAKEMKQVLGIDVGGTKIAAGIVDRNLKVSRVSILPTSQTDLLAQIVRLLHKYNEYHAVSIGVPGTVSNGKINKLPNVRNFKPINLKQYLAKQVKLPIYVLNDAEAFTLGEAKMGAGRKYKKVFGVILGTGLGGGFVVKNKHKDCGSILHQTLPGIESEMKAIQKTQPAKDYKPLLVKLLPTISEKFNPDMIIFGGARSQIPGMQKELDNCRKLFAHRKISVKVSKLKHAGIIGTALPLLKH